MKGENKFSISTDYDAEEKANSNNSSFSRKEKKLRINSEFFIKPKMFVFAILLVVLLFSGEAFTNNAVKIGGLNIFISNF